MSEAASIDFGAPPGEPALVSADSVSWRIFKNPLTLYVGGVTAVILELAEPRVRSGVWEHSSFRREPLGRLQRTGLAALVTVFAARSAAERMIAGVTRRHEKVRGTTPDGVAYHALDPELLRWVQVTAGFGFLEAYRGLVQPLPREARDDFYAEAEAAACLYGAPGAPRSEAEVEALFESTLPRLEPSPAVFEFLDIMQRTPSLPRGLAGLRRALIGAAVARVPEPVRERLGLGADFEIGALGQRALALAASAADRAWLRSSAPPARACARLGLPASHLRRPL